jgi:Tfp pilus assembly protein PilP
MIQTREVRAMWSRYLMKLGFCSALVAAPMAGMATAQTQGSNQEQTQTGAAGAPPAAGAGQAAPAQQEPLPTVPEGIEITEGSGYRYDAHGRRDPFVSLALGLNVLLPEERPQGLRGMLIQEVSLRGIVKTQDGYIAMIQGTDNKSYFARNGERLYDGNIQEIDDTRVVFRQEINDPLRIEKFQQVEKSLHPVEEGQR